MNRLQSELRRLYLVRPDGPDQTEAQAATLIGPGGTVRAMVMELTGPPSWDVLSIVWHGVQTQLDLPAPAIAVSGVDGLQLWFSLSEPIPVSQAHRFLTSLQARFLPDIKAGRLRLMPAPDAAAAHPQGHAWLVPACQERTGHWSAFVAPDLAPVFSDTPWIDIPPNEEGQAALLRALEVTKPASFAAAQAQLAPSEPHAQPVAPVELNGEAEHAHDVAQAAADQADPRRFLRRVMNDDTVTLALRIEAAKALLQQRD